MRGEVQGEGNKEEQEAMQGGQVGISSCPSCFPLPASDTVSPHSGAGAVAHKGIFCPSAHTQIHTPTHTHTHNPGTGALSQPCIHWRDTESWTRDRERETER